MTWTPDSIYECHAAKIAPLVVQYLQGRCIDVGSGPGKVWPQVIGIDLGHDHGRPVTDVMMDGTNVCTFADDSIDGVFSSYLLNCFDKDTVPDVLREWSCPAFLLIAGGSSVLAGDAPAEMAGWSCGLGDDNSPQRYWLKDCSLSGSGLAVKGQHILDPRTGSPSALRNRVWALTDTAAESDALSTACMILREPEISEVVQKDERWLVVLQEEKNWRHYGNRPVPPMV